MTPKTTVKNDLDSFEWVKQSVAQKKGSSAFKEINIIDSK